MSTSTAPQVEPEAEMLNWGRLILDGVNYADMVAARDRPRDVPWLSHWMARADFYESLADAAERSEHLRTAGEYLISAGLCAQYAQFLWFDERRQAAQQRKVDLYRRAAPMLAPPAERIDLPVHGLTMPVYVRRPQTPGPHPLVVMLGGLESTKEESYQMENLVLERGMATATFDGPGQGEMWADRGIAGNFEDYTSAVIDRLASDPGIRSNAIAVLGRSLGGNYALKSASCDDRIAACVVWGGFSDMDEWDAETPLTKESWRYASKVDTLDEARDHVREALETRHVLPQLSCPTYVLHGALDEIPMTFIDTLKSHVTEADLTIVIEDEGDHCCHNLGPRPRYAMADWLADVLCKTPISD